MAGISAAIGGWVQKAFSRSSEEMKADIHEMKADTKAILSSLTALEKSHALHGAELATMRGNIVAVEARQNEQAKAHKAERDEQAKAHQVERDDILRRLALLEAKVQK